MFKTALFFLVGFFTLLRADVRAILTDIEGTTTSISFVHDSLFPYAKEHLREFLTDHWAEERIASIVQQVRETANTPEAGYEEIAGILHAWMEQDKKITPLKSLQGLMWEEGYKNGSLKGHVYEDAFVELKNWQERGIPLYVYSSGSVQAQQLLFSHSNFGNLTPLFSGYFDTKIGGKKESRSYLAILQQVGAAPDETLFLSDSVDELDAAASIGMKTILLCREGIVPPKQCLHSAVSTFSDIFVK